MRIIPPSELIINADGSVFHLHLKPSQLADTVILVGDPGRVDMVSAMFDSVECRVESREFRAVTPFGADRFVFLCSVFCDNPVF